MGVNTTRVGLYKPGGGSSGIITPDEAADIDKINENSDRIDAVIGAPPFASTNLPSGAVRFDGMIILESDTQLLKVFKQDGTEWVLPYGANLQAEDLDGLPSASARPGVRCYVKSLKCDFQAVDGTWVQIGFARVADSSARDTEYAKASAAYRVSGALVKQDDELFFRYYDGDSWEAYTAPIYIQSETPGSSAPNDSIQLY